jgi:hypothetical protein
MNVRSLLWSMISLSLVLCLTACFPGIQGKVLEPEGKEEIELEGEEEIELEGEEVELDPELPSQQELAKEGDAQVEYYYSIQMDDLSFVVNPIIGLSIYPEADGSSFTISGIGQDRVDFTFLAGSGPDNTCRTWCTVDLNFVADGTVESDPDLHSCKMLIRFTFVPSTENVEMTTECPPPSDQVLDCARMSMNMLDPSVYTFTRDDRNPTIPSDGATLYAKMTNLTLPSGLVGICDW